MARQSFLPDARLNGQPVDCRLNAQFTLAALNYRYVVFHKPQPGYRDYQPGAWGEAEALTFLKQTFGDQPPLVDDELTRVYQIANEIRAMSINFSRNWYARENQRRWAASPATLQLLVPQPQTATLQLRLAYLYDPNSANPLAVDGPKQRGVLEIRLNHNLLDSVEVSPGQTISIPLTLVAGANEVTLTSRAGNFKPADFGSDDYRELSFAIDWIDLQTTP